MDTMDPRARTVLISNRDPAVRDLLAQRLEAEGYGIEQRGRDTPLLDLAREVHPSLILHTVVDGTVDDLIRLRRDDLVPLILLVDGSSPPVDAADLLDLGADDVVGTPSTPREVVARVRATLRRAASTPCPVSVAVRGLAIDLKARAVTVRGVPVELARREYDLLAFLSLHPAEVFSRSQLLTRVWDSDDAWQSAATVTEHVRRLRLRLGPAADGGEWIETVRGVGYRLRA